MKTTRLIVLKKEQHTSLIEFLENELKLARNKLTLLKRPNRIQQLEKLLLSLEEDINYLIDINLNVNVNSSNNCLVETD